MFKKESKIDEIDIVCRQCFVHAC